MLKINHCIYNNLEIEDYRATFITYVEQGMRGNYETFNNLQKAKENSAYGEVYIAFKLVNK